MKDDTVGTWERERFECVDCGEMVAFIDAIVCIVNGDDALTCICRACVKERHREAVRQGFTRGFYAQDGQRHCQEDNTL